VEAAAQTDELDETTESQRERMATMQREYELKLEVSERTILAVVDLANKAADEAAAAVKKYKQAVEERREEMKQEYDKWLDEEIVAHNSTRKMLATMEREYEARLESMETKVEVLKGRVEISHHIYTELAAQTEEVLDNTTALPEGIPEEIPTREEGGGSHTHWPQQQRRMTLGLWIK